MPSGRPRGERALTTMSSVGEDVDTVLPRLEVAYGMALKTARPRRMETRSLKRQRLWRERRQAGVPSMFCPITLELMRDPVIALDGYAYERHAIETWFQHQWSRKMPILSPMTNLRLPSTLIISAHTLRKVIDECTTTTS
jgi:hypothetical protein